jgi:Na+-translocating ferredoxin:NAD+ oxidoreductase RnfE subunit
MENKSLIHSNIKPVFQNMLGIIPLSLVCYSFANGWIISLSFLFASLLTFVLSRLLVMIIEKKHLILVVVIASIFSVTIISLILQILVPKTWENLEFFVYIMLLPLIQMS